MKLPNKLYLSETDYIDFKNAQIVIDGKPPQTLKEFELYLLELFVTNINVLVKYEIIEKHMEDIKNHLRKGGKSGNDFVFSRESLRNIIGNIRDYGESIRDCIVNERALGYKFVLSQEFIDKSEFPESVTDIYDNNNTVEVDGNFVFDSESDDYEENVTKLTLLKKLKSKKFLYVCIPVILAIAILSGAIFGINFTSFKAIQDVYHITVNKPKAFNDEDREILEQRVKIFADGEKYSIDFNEDKIEMYIPVSSFNDNEVEYVLDAYITNAINLYAINSKEQSLNDAIFIDRDDIESVNVLNGPIEGVDASEYGIGISNYKYFRIILKDGFITKNSEALKKLGESLTFAQDVNNDGWYYYCTFPQDDGKTFYVLNDDLSNMPLLSTDINNIDINTGTISFSNICQIQDGKIINESIDDDYSYLLDMFNAISETSDNMESLSFVSYQFNVNKHGKGMILVVFLLCRKFVFNSNSKSSPG